MLTLPAERNIRHRHPNNHVEFLSNCIRSTISNFCPSKIDICHFTDVSWMTNEIKYTLSKKTKIYKEYIQNINDFDYKERLDLKMIETRNLILNAKENYYKSEGNKLLVPSLDSKILNSFLGNNIIPIIPPHSK